MRLAFHPPCTLQHGQQLRGGVEKHLGALGFDVSLAASESHLCCGSAGTYSILEPAMSGRLREKKLAALGIDSPDLIASGNVGCQLHLAGTTVPVMHWIELLDTGA